jgi:LuxR family maltose regulon positive regulatory protein
MSTRARILVVDGSLSPQTPVRGRPVLRGDVVARPRLLKRLESALDVGVVYVSGAAGSGKTTLLATWLQTLPTSTRAAWLTLQPEHNDPVRLADDLRASPLDEGFAVSSQAGAGSFDDVLSALLQPTPGSPVVLVLDDIHVIHAREVADTIGSVLGRLPTGSCIVVCGREDPGLHWAVLRERRAIVEIDDDDLRFDEEETRRLLHDVFGIDADDRRVANAVTAAGGWAAGLVLTGVAAQAQPGSTIDVCLSPRHRQIIDGFIHEAILATCPPEIRDFLSVTSILPVLEPSMCDLLTGREDSGTLLRELVDRNMLTEELAGPSPAFRYHALLRRALLDRQSRQGLEHLSGKIELVVQELAEKGRLLEATELALEAGPPRDAEKWVRQSCGPALAQGYAATVVRWLSGLPADQIHSQPDLLLMLARAAGASGDLLTAKAAVRRARHLTDGIETSPGVQLGLKMLDTDIGIWEGSLDASVSSLRDVLTEISEHAEDPVVETLGLTRSSVLSLLAVGLLLQGRLDEAIDVAEEVITFDELSPLTRHAVFCLGVRPLAMAWAGRDREAAAEVEAAMPLVASWNADAKEAMLFWVAAACVGPLAQAEQNLARAQRLRARTAVPLLKALPAVSEPGVRQRLGQYDRLPEASRRAGEALASVPEPGHLDELLSGQVMWMQLNAGSPPDLSRQELSVLQGIAGGKSRKEVAEQMHYSINTVKTYLRSTYRKLGVSDRSEALTRARAWGLLE